MAIDPNQIQVDPEISRAWTLPAGLYYDPAVYAVEKEQIFAASWQVLGHRDQAANPGDYFTTELTGEPLLLVREPMHGCAAFTTSADIAPVQ